MSKVAFKAENIGLCYHSSYRLSFLGKRSDAFWALEDLSFELYHGECLGIVGRNGAGKSTLLRVIAGIYRPDRGKIEDYNNSVALLSLGAGFINSLSGRDNMILSAMLLGLPRKKVLERLDDMVEFSELGKFIDEPIFTYSTGMRARLGFSVAIQSDPDIILVDEVLGVGDRDFKEKSSAKMKELIRSGKTVVIISHQAGTIKELCSRAIWIESGVTKMSGPVEEVIAQYEAS